MLRERIKRKAHDVVYSAGTSNPEKVCDVNPIPVYYADLGKNIMAYHTVIKRIPAIVLSTRNSEPENVYACCHELGHHFCRHKGNAECLNKSNLVYSAMGDEAEANQFMVDMLLDGVDVTEYDTKEQLMKACGIPSWAERYVEVAIMGGNYGL